MISPLFGSKAATLIALQSRVLSAKIAPLVCFTVADWLRDRAGCLALLHDLPEPWIVRSSCLREDSAASSKAGVFLSITAVRRPQLVAAIEQVVQSYQSAQPEDEVLIQPQLNSVWMSGVAASHDANSGAPYRSVNWHEGTDTRHVTAGLGGRCWQQAAESPLPPPLLLQPVMRLLAELLEIFDHSPLEFEFALVDSPTGPCCYLLQVRPLVLSAAPETATQQTERLRWVEAKLQSAMLPHPFLLGQTTLFGVMPDWNPAEMIGLCPKPLALSLYRELITDSLWAQQRHQYGYRHVRGFALMPHFFGRPYIDVRLSLNSFIPADLAPGLAERLVNYYLARLQAEPQLHDKLEFQIVLSCYSLDLPQRLLQLQQAGFSADEVQQLAESLRRLTNRLWAEDGALWRADVAKLACLQQRRTALQQANLSPLESMYWLLTDAKEYGSAAFVGLARLGFIAMQLLQSLVSLNLLSLAQYETFMASLSTVNSQLRRDRAVLEPAHFLARYGHLRPGTYEVGKARYDAAPEQYFDWQQPAPALTKTTSFSLTPVQYQQIDRHLQQQGLLLNAQQLLDFIRHGIEWREQAKFEFSQNLSDALELSVSWAQQWGFNREQVAFTEISVFNELQQAVLDPRQVLARSIAAGQARYQQTLALVLPSLIRQPEDIWAFEWPENQPNFITRKQITAHLSQLQPQQDLTGAIVCIPNADPGFDWLFSQPIAGLITAWGGANSHMAIRAGELGLPAVIGCGELLYRRWSQASRLSVDCAAQRVEVLD